MQPKDGVQAVEETTDLLDVLVIGPFDADIVDQLPEPPDLVGNLDVGTAHRGCWLASPEDALEGRVEDLLLRLLMGPDLFHEELVHGTHFGHRTCSLHGPQG